MGSSPVAVTYGKNVWIFTKQKKNKVLHDEVLLKIAFLWNLVEPKLTYARLSDNLVLPKINGSQSRKTSVLMY